MEFSCVDDLLSYFFKKITLSQRDGPCSQSVSQSVEYVCISHQSGLRYYSNQ